MKNVPGAIPSVIFAVLLSGLMTEAEVWAQTPPPIIVPQVQPRFNSPGPQVTIPQPGNPLQQRTISPGSTFVPSRSAGTGAGEPPAARRSPKFPGLVCAGRRRISFARFVSFSLRRTWAAPHCGRLFISARCIGRLIYWASVWRTANYNREARAQWAVRLVSPRIREGAENVKARPFWGAYPHHSITKLVSLWIYQRVIWHVIPFCIS